MDFFRDKATGQLFAHGRLCDGWIDEGVKVEGALIHTAEEHKPIWMPWTDFKERFEHIELRTSQEAWERASLYWMFAFLAATVGAMLLASLALFVWQGIETRESAWPASIALIIAAALLYRRSRKLGANYQWDSWKRKLKETPNAE